MEHQQQHQNNLHYRTQRNYSLQFKATTLRDNSLKGDAQHCDVQSARLNSTICSGHTPLSDTPRNSIENLRVYFGQIERC